MSESALCKNKTNLCDCTAHFTVWEIISIESTIRIHKVPQIKLFDSIDSLHSGAVVRLATLSRFVVALLAGSSLLRCRGSARHVPGYTHDQPLCGCLINRVWHHFGLVVMARIVGGGSTATLLGRPSICWCWPGSRWFLRHTHSINYRSHDRSGRSSNCQ